MVCPQHIKVMFKSSKTDFSRQVWSVVIAKAPRIVCTVSAMQWFFLTTLSSRGPLFSFQLGQLLTDQQSYAFLEMLHCTLVNPIIASRAIVFVSVQLLQRLLQAYPLTHSIPFVPLGR